MTTGERDFHRADFQLAGTHVDDRLALANEAAFAQFASPQDAHALLGVVRVDRHAVIVDAHVGHSETADQLHPAGAHHEARRAGPCLGLRGQDARPGRLVERAGDTLRTQRISRRIECARVGERASPMHDARQFVAHNRDRERGLVRQRMTDVNMRSGELEIGTVELAVPGPADMTEILLRGQDARPGRLVERAGDTLRTQRISRRNECARVGERASPLHAARQFVAHNRERERGPCGALLKIHDADLFAAARSPEEIHDCHIPALPVRMRHCTS